MKLEYLKLAIAVLLLDIIVFVVDEQEKEDELFDTEDEGIEKDEQHSNHGKLNSNHRKNYNKHFFVCNITSAFCNEKHLFYAIPETYRVLSLKGTILSSPFYLLLKPKLKKTPKSFFK